MGAQVHISDRDLLRQTRAGDAESFAAFYRVRRGDVLAFLRVRVADGELAADLMCETFVQALVAVHDRDRELPVVPIAWLITIARNTLIDSLRRGRVADDVRRRLQMEPLVLEDTDLTEVEEAAATAGLMDDLKDALPADQLAAFIARVFDERGYEDIARQLETSPSVVRKRVSRAAAQLRSIREERA